MAVRILLILIGITIVINLVITAVGLIMNVNLYKTYGKQILNFFIMLTILVIAVFIICSVISFA